MFFASCIPKIKLGLIIAPSDLIQNKMQQFNQQIRTQLRQLAEPKYQQFAQKLIPHCDNLLGVRVPILRQLAKELAAELPLLYLQNNDEIYFEERMLKALIIGNLPADVATIMQQVQLFVPKIPNWSICDSFCTELKICHQHPQDFWDLITPYWHQPATYEVRFAVVMLLRYFISQPKLDEIFDILTAIKHPDYYVKMAVAWAVASCCILYPQETILFLQSQKLAPQTQQFALQKIRDSKQIAQHHKIIASSIKPFN